MRKILFLLTLVSFFSCKKTEEKADKPVELKNEIVLDTVQQETAPREEEKEEEVFAKSISDLTTKELIETFKNNGVVNFYFVLENDKAKAEIQTATMMDLVKLFRETKYTYGLSVSRNNMYRKMTVKITYNDQNKADLEVYFSKIKEILSKIHEKGVQIET